MIPHRFTNSVTPSHFKQVWSQCRLPHGLLAWLTLVFMLMLKVETCADPTNCLTVAAVSCEVKIRDTSHNLQRIAHWTRRAAEEDAELVLFPECTLQGWWQSRENRRYAEPIDGPSIQRVRYLAQQYNLLIAVGMTEEHAGRYYLTHVIVGPSGVLGLHRKSDLAGGATGEAAVWDMGNDANVFDIKGFKVGMAICFESVHPQTCRRLKAAGAEIILAPYANGTRPQEIRDPARSQRAWLWERVKENRVWYVGCDATPHDGDGRLVPGAAFVISPQQRLIKCTPVDGSGEGMVVHRIFRRKPIQRPQ